MSSGLWWQYALIAALVAASLLYTFRKMAPQLAARLQAAAAALLTRRFRSGPMAALGRWLGPREAGGSCGDGCGACGSCGTSGSAPARPDAQPLEFHPRRR